MKNSKTILFVLIVVILAVVTFFVWKQYSAKPVGESRELTMEDCQIIGSSWVLFEDPAAPISFCFYEHWGMPNYGKAEIDPSVVIGSRYDLSFTDSAIDAPVIALFSTDFQKTGDSDVPNFDWAIVDLSKSDEQIAQDYTNWLKTTGNSDVTVQAEKITVKGRDMVKIKSDYTESFDQTQMSRVSYYLPKIKINGKTMNLIIGGSSETESLLPTILETLTIK